MRNRDFPKDDDDEREEVEIDKEGEYQQKRSPAKTNEDRED